MAQTHVFSEMNSALFLIYSTLHEVLIQITVSLPYCFEKKTKHQSVKVKSFKCHYLHFIKFDGIKVPNLGIDILDLCERLNLAFWFSSLFCTCSSTFEFVFFASPSE